MSSRRLGFGGNLLDSCWGHRVVFVWKMWRLDRGVQTTLYLGASALSPGSGRGSWVLGDIEGGW